jgi:hypothetical protein
MPSIVNCYQCGGKAVLNNADEEKHYNESGLCPICWNQAMEESSNSKASIEARLDIIISILTSMKEELSK